MASRIRVDSTIADLESDCRRIATSAKRDMSEAVKVNAIEGNQFAKTLASVTAGSHGKHYPSAFTVERITPLIYEYGPDAGRPQGGMSFEHGSRNQPAHNDLANSADVAGPQLQKDVSRLPERWFWPE